MDATDHRIIAELQRNGRARITDLAESVGLSPTPCARRVAALEESGVITGYGARIDQAKLGLPLSVFIAIELDRQSADAIEAFESSVSRFDEVMECYLMTGSRDILMRVVAADLAAFDRFLEKRLMHVPGIRSMRSSFTLRAVVQREALPIG